MNNLEFRVPKNEDEFNEYDLFRWRLLRKPIGKTIESLKDEYEDNSFHLIGVIDNQIVACGRLHFIDNSKAQIRYMAVDEKYQRKGLGSSILSLLESHAKKNNADKIILNARDHAIKFYATAKYKILKRYYGSDTGIPHTTMIKDI
jgi:predicted GNAT family N-acyltransferase